MKKFFILTCLFTAVCFFITVLILLNLEIILYSIVLAYIISPIASKISSIIKLDICLVSAAIIIAVIACFISIVVIIMPDFLFQIKSIASHIFANLKNIETYKIKAINFISNNVLCKDYKSLDRIVNNAISKIDLSYYSILYVIQNNVITVIVNIFEIFITMILSFFIIINKEMIEDTAFGLIPTASKNYVIDFISNSSELIKRYFLGALQVVCIMCAYYTIAIWICGISYPIALGILSGVSILVPVFGLLCISVFSLLLNVMIFGFSNKLIYILLIYIFGAILESYFITPKVVGSKVNLRPFWIILSLLVFGKLFGIIGLIIAIPTVGILKIFMSQAYMAYKNSEFYNKK